MRRQFVDGKGVPCLVAVDQDPKGEGEALALSYAKGIGGTRQASSRRRSRTRPKPTCSASRPCSAAAPRNSIKTGFEVMVEAGYAPELAYFEVLHELKLIVDLIYEGGIARMNTRCPTPRSSAATCQGRG